jgi:hypothetical protein
VFSYTGGLDRPLQGPVITALVSSLKVRPTPWQGARFRGRGCSLLVVLGLWSAEAAAEGTAELGAPKGLASATSDPVAEDGINPDKDKSDRGEKKGSKLLEIGVGAALERARSSYQAARYDDCVREYGQLLQHLDEMEEISAGTVEQARTYYAACALATGDREEADRQLRAALSSNPLMASPDPVVFPDQVRDLFFKVKADFLDEIQRVQDEKMEAARLEAEKRAELIRQEQRRVERLESMVASETVVHENYRWIASVPFGVGQFQNGDAVWGGIFLGTQLLALGTAVFAVSSELSIHSQANGGRDVRDAKSYNEPLTQLRTAGVIGSAAFVFLATVGILEAHINFVPERPVGPRPRPLPPEVRRKPPAVVPTVTSHGNDLGLGLAGRF